MGLSELKEPGSGPSGFTAQTRTGGDVNGTALPVLRRETAADFASDWPRRRDQSRGGVHRLDHRAIARAVGRAVRPPRPACPPLRVLRPFTARCGRRADNRVLKADLSALVNCIIGNLTVTPGMDALIGSACSPAMFQNKYVVCACPGQVRVVTYGFISGDGQVRVANGWSASPQPSQWLHTEPCSWAVRHPELKLNIPP